MTNDLVKRRRSHANQSLAHVTLVKDCFLEMATYADVMIDNADVYRASDRGAIYRLYTPPGQYSRWIYAPQDIDIIDKAASKCIDAIDKHNMPK